MTASFVAVLPAIAPDLAERCIDSMCEDLRRSTLVIDNTTDGYWIKIPNDPTIMWERSTFNDNGLTARRDALGNVGVANSWNFGIERANEHDADYLIIISQSIMFGPVGGYDFLDQLNERQPEVLMHSQHGWHLLAISRRTLDTVGMFDPVFPHYGNDTDYLYRMALAGLPSPRENGGLLDQIVVNASCERDGETIRRGLVSGFDYGTHLNVYRDKWGGDQGSETFDRPYNDGRLDWKHTGPRPDAA